MLGLMLLSTAFAGLAKSASGDDFSKETISFSKSEHLEFGNYRVELVGLTEDQASIEVYEDDNLLEPYVIDVDDSYTENDNFNLVYVYSEPQEEAVYLKLRIPLEEEDYNDNLFEDNSESTNGYEFEIMGFRHNDDSDDENPYSDGDDEVEIKVTYLGDELGTKWIEEGDSEDFGNDQFSDLVKISIDDDAIEDDEPDDTVDTPYVVANSLDAYFPKPDFNSYEVIGDGSGSDSGSDGEDQTSLLEDYLMFSGESIELSNGDSYTISTTSPGLRSDQVYLQVEKNGEVIEDSIGLSEYTSSRESVGSLELAIGAIDTQRESYYLNVWAPSDYSISQEPDREAGVSMNPTLGNNEAIVGQQVEVQIQGIESIGSADAYGLKVVGPVPDGFDLNGNNVMGPVDLASGNVISEHTYFLQPNSPGEYEIGDVEVTYSDDVKERSNSFSFQNSTLTVYGEPDLSAGVQVMKDGVSSEDVEVLPNGNVTLNYEIRNVGEGPARNVEVTLNGDSKVVDEIGAGESAEVSFDYVAGSAGAKTLDSVISFDNALGEGSDSFDKPVPLVVAEPPKPDLKIESMVVPNADSSNPMGSIDANEPVVYRVKISNEGAAEAQDVRVDFRNLTKSIGDVGVNKTKDADFQYVFEQQEETQLSSNITYTFENAVDQERSNLNVSKTMTVQNSPIDFNPQTMLITLIIALAIIAAAYYYNKSSALEEEKGRRKDMSNEGGLPDHKK